MLCGIYSLLYSGMFRTSLRSLVATSRTPRQLRSSSKKVALSRILLHKPNLFSAATQLRRLVVGKKSVARPSTVLRHSLTNSRESVITDSWLRAQPSRSQFREVVRILVPHQIVPAEWRPRFRRRSLAWIMSFQSTQWYVNP